MPLAMRNLAIAQQRDWERYLHVRGGGYSRPRAYIKVGDFLRLKQEVGNTPEVPM